MIVGIAGTKNSGKNTLAQMLLRRVPGAKAIAFADPMKDFVAQVYDWPREKLEDMEFKETPDPRHAGLRPRAALQSLGTGWGRECYRNTWVDLGLRRARELEAAGCPLVILTDVRFQNEAEAINAACGRVVRIIRDTGAVDTHASEQEVDSITGWYQVVNEGSLAALEAHATRLVMMLADLGLDHPAFNPVRETQEAFEHRAGITAPKRVVSGDVHTPGCSWCGQEGPHTHEVTPAPRTVAEMQRESFETAKEKGWHDEDDQPPSEAVREIAVQGMRIKYLCAGVEGIRRGDRPGPYVVFGDRFDTSQMLDGLYNRQVRALCWLTLICTEAAEAMEDVIAGRWEMIIGEDGKPAGLPSEAADILVRCGDSFTAMGVDLEDALRVKMAFNKTRSRKHGGKLA